MIDRNPVVIPLRPVVNPARTRMPLSRNTQPVPVAPRHILRTVPAATATDTAPAPQTDPAISAAFAGVQPTRPAQSRNRPNQRGTALVPKPQPKATIQRANIENTGLSVSSLATIYGCCGLFDLCSDRDLMSFSFQGADPFMDWIGWERTDVCLIKKNFISYTRPEYADGSPTAGYLANPCDDPKGVDWGACDFTLEDFARLRRQGPTRDITKGGVRLCETAPRYRLDGTPITDDREYEMRVAMEVMLQDLKRMTVSGNAATPGQFSGLELLVKNGYTNSNGVLCQAMDSIVIDWNGGALTSTAGVTWNGDAIATGYTFIDVLLAAYRNIEQRIRMSPVLASQQQQVGDMVLVLPTAFIDCVLNLFTCWRVCNGAQYNENNLDSLEARNFRNSLDGGLFGAGQIMLHGRTIPILPFDYGLIKTPSHFDAYLLTGSIGNVKMLQGQYNDMNYAATTRADRYAVTDGGRVLTYSQDDHTCEKRVIEMQPRLLSWAPWANVRFEDLHCTTLGPILSPDPTESSFYPLKSFESAECPTDEAAVL